MHRLDPQKLSGTTVKNRVLVTSTGTASLDSLFGGGLPNSSLVVIDEVYGSRKYFPPIARCFLVEGIFESQTIVCASPKPGTTLNLLKNLPQRSGNLKQSTGDGGDSKKDNEKTVMEYLDKKTGDADFRIAWRYSTMPKVDSSIRNSDIVKFDLSREYVVDVEALKSEGRLYLLDQSFSNFSTLSDLWARLHALMSREEFTDSVPVSQRKFLRVLLPEMSLPLWIDMQDLVIFFINLKAFCRKLYCVVMIGIDSSLLPSNVTRDILRLADAFIRLEFVNEEVQKSMALHQKFDGRLYVLKLPVIFSAAPHRPDCLDFIFSLKRTHFDIKIFHLPPALDEGNVVKNMPCQQVQEEF